MKNRMKYGFLLALLSFGTMHASDPVCGEPCGSNKCRFGDVEVRGEFLYWQPRVSGMAYAATNILEPTPLGFSLPSDVDYKSVSFDYKPGYRIGARYLFPTSDWDIDASWTHFQASGSDSIAASGATVISTFWEQLGSVTASTASANLNVHLDNVDINLGKKIKFFDCFILRPFVGASYYKLHVNNQINYTGVVAGAGNVPGQANIALHAHSHGWGLDFGTESLWQLPYGFGLYGKGSYSILCSQNDNTIGQRSVSPDAGVDVSLSAKNNFSTFNQIFKINCGLSWDYVWCCRGSPIDIYLFAGYEFNYFPSQIELNRPQFGGANNAVIPLQSSGDVGFHGLTTGLSITF